MRNAFLVLVLAALITYLIMRRRDEETDTASVFDLFDSNAGTTARAGSYGASLAETGNMADVRKWAEAIKSFEGWKPGSRSYRNNNPGNLKGNFAGATGTDKDGFAVFPSEAVGMAALESDLRAKVRKYSDWSLLDIMRRYLGGGKGIDPPKAEGNAQQYAGTIAAKLGVSINDTLGKIFG